MSDRIPTTPPPSMSGIQFKIEYRRSRHFDVSDLCRIAIERNAQNSRPVLITDNGHFIVADFHSNTIHLKMALVTACQEIYRRCHGDEGRIKSIYEQVGIDPDGMLISAYQIRMLKDVLGE